MASAEHVVKVRAELDNAFVVRPGDKLVIRVSRALNQAEAHEMKERLAERLPGIEAVIIMCDGLAVYRPGEVPPAGWHPTDAQLTTWIRVHEPEFKAWLARQARIHGGLDRLQRDLS